MTKLYFLLLIVAAACAGAAASSAAAAPPCRICAPAVVVAAPVVHEEVRVREVLVPILQPLPYFADPRISYHYGVGAYAAAPAAVQAVAPTHTQQAAKSAVADIDALIDRIEARVRERQQFQAAEPSGPPEVPGFQRTSSVAVKCAACHTGPSSKGGFVIFDSPGVWSQRFDPQAAWDAVANRRMPPKNQPPLSQAEVAAIGNELGFSPTGR